MNLKISSGPRLGVIAQAHVVLRVIATLLVVASGIWAGWQLWDYYTLAPWTRNGRVRADIIQIAPDLSGAVSRVAVRDNQYVEAGDLLFSLDKARFELALEQSNAAAVMQVNSVRNLKISLAQAQRESVRNTNLGDLISQEVREQSLLKVDQVKIALDAAEAALHQTQTSIRLAQLNLQRTEIRAPASGIITNLELHQGAYANAGHASMALIDRKSIYVEGYFEENKLSRISVGSRAKLTPMGFNSIEGTVESIAAGISERDRSTGANLLPNVNPTFSWVRLAQRIPVRIKLDQAPENNKLTVGQTVTVEILDKDRPIKSNAEIVREAH